MAISFWIWDVAHRGVVDLFSLHKNFPPFSRSLPPFSSIRLSIWPLFKSPIFIFFSLYIVSSFKSSHSSSSLGTWAYVPVCGTCNDFRLFKHTIKLRWREKKRWGKHRHQTWQDKGKGQKLDGDQRVREIFRETVSLFIVMKTKFQLNCSSSLCKTKFRFNVGVLCMWAGVSSLYRFLFFVLPEKRGTAHTHT